jgi:eukaryotic-like serine/threonine-protein kinase
MYLWTEFEGATIDSAFALTKLLQTEGRSAFFSTLNASGEPVLIRIIECHFDEDEILARWRGVQALGHPNFLRIDRFGQFQVEGDENITAVYVVFERVDANLGEVLERGRLSSADATQIGLSVSSALETLHINGFVHEHIEARNIYAVGDKVKLRSDCIRESPEGEAGMEARRRDVHALAVVLMQVLLGTPGSASAPNQPLLPAPFDEIVGNGMNGSWGLAEIKAALGRCDLPNVKPQRATRPEPSLKQAAPPVTKGPSLAASASNGHFSAGEFPPGQAAKLEPSPERSTSPVPNSATRDDPAWQKPAAMELPVIFGISEHEIRRWATAVAVLLGVVLVGWMFLHYWFGRGAGAASQPVPTQPAATNTRAAAPSPALSSSPAGPAPGRGSQSSVKWRVVAFTYHRQDQAQKKATSLAQKYPNLSPAVFSPTGRAPWLVTVGGTLERDAAYALARRAPSLGLPRDTYAQNFTAR